MVKYHQKNIIKNNTFMSIYISEIKKSMGIDGIVDRKN